MLKDFPILGWGLDAFCFLLHWEEGNPGVSILSAKWGKKGTATTIVVTPHWWGLDALNLTELQSFRLFHNCFKTSPKTYHHFPILEAYELRFGSDSE